MNKRNRIASYKLTKRIGSLALAVSLASTGIYTDNIQVSAEAQTSNSWKQDVGGAIDQLQNAMGAEGDYQEAVEGLQTALDGLEGSRTVEGLAVTEVGEDYIILEWLPFASEDLLGYNVYWSDSNKESSKFLLLGKDGKTSKKSDDMTLSVEEIQKDAETIVYKVNKSTKKNYYFKVAPVTSVGVGSKCEAVMSPTAVSFDAYVQGSGRGLTVTKTEKGVVLNWRLHAEEVKGYSDTGLTGTDFHIYRNKELIATVSDSTNYLDTENTGELEADTYVLVPLDEAGEEITEDACMAYEIFTADAANQNVAYKDIPLQKPANTTFRETYGIDTMALGGYTMTDAGYNSVDDSITYTANDMSSADVDGDGEYEYIVEWDPSYAKDVSQQGYTGKQYLDCYELDGTILWRLDLGVNIRAGAHYTEFGVFDYDKDGKAEMVLKTAPGTKMIKYAISEEGKNILGADGLPQVASEDYVNILPEDQAKGVTDGSNFVFSASDYRSYLIDVFKDWGVWSRYSEETVKNAIAGHWSGNLVELLGVSASYDDSTFYTGQVKSSANVTFSVGNMTTQQIQEYIPAYKEGDELVNVCLRDEAGKIQYVSSYGGVNPVLKTVRVEDVKNYYGNLPLETCNFDATETGYTEEQATILADYFLKHYEYRMKKHSLEVYEGYIVTGPEYVSLFDCESGDELDTVTYHYEREDDGMLWGDYAMNYIEPGNRCDRFNTATAYLDGETPSAICARGYYTRTTFAAYNVVGKKLQLVGAIDSGWTVMDNPFNDGPHGFDGCDEKNGMLSGEGNHYVAVADVDGDGKQDLINGGAIVSYKDGAFYLYSAGGDYLTGGTGSTWAKYGHGDAIHVADIDPDNPGLEIASCFEGGAWAPYNWAVRDAETNTVLFGAPGTTDYGRLIIGDVLPNVRGLEVDAGFDCKGNAVSLTGVSNNMNIKWSQNMTTQFVTGTSTVSIIGNVDGKSHTFLSTSEFATNNSTKGNPGLVADLFGDYREEMIVRSTDSSKLRIYMNTEVSEHKNYTLMENLQYRVGIASQNSSYNQPAYTDYYYAADTDWSRVTMPNTPSNQKPGKVVVNPANVTLNVTAKTLLAGETLQLTAKVTPSTAEQTVIYSVDDDSVVSVDETGLVTALKKGTAIVTVSTINEKTSFCRVVVKGNYETPGLDKFAVGDTKEFLFGKEGNVTADTIYTKEAGFGFEQPKNITLTTGSDYVAGTNYRTGSSNATYEYPTFTMDVPVGIYEVTLVQGTNGSEDAVNGAYVEGNMYSVRWSSENFSVGFTEPSPGSYLYTKAGETKESVVTTAVADGQLNIQFATSLTDDGVSGTTYIKEIQVKRCEQIADFSKKPTLRFIGDSTLAKYPPEDSGEWAEIPERTGWGEEFSMGRFVDDSVVLVNKAVAGSSLASYVTDGYYNDFFLNSHPGDTVIIESGINDSAAGRRYSDATTFEKRLRYLIDSCQAFGLDVIISSGTSSSTTYTAKMESLAKEYEIPYVDLLGQWNQYLGKTGKGSGDVTVDGTHLDRVGGVVAAQIVANSIADEEGLYISGHVKKIPLNYEAPTLVVTGVSVKAQTEGSTTLSWNVNEGSLYQPDQLITGFQIYGKQKGASSEYKLITTQTAYVSAGMKGTKMTATFETPGEGTYMYYVVCTGLTGEGPKSSVVNVAPFSPSTEYSLLKLVDRYNEQLYDASTYTVASYTNLKMALAEAKQVLQNTKTTAEDEKAALSKLEEAVAGLVENGTCVERNDFEKEAIKTAPWNMGGNQAGLASLVMEEDGNRQIKLYVEAAGQRYVNKAFATTDVNAATEMIAFEWYPGNPDVRNCTEMEFLSSDSNRVISLKTANNGHIGYVVGNYPADNSYLIGDGFHAYEGSKAVDLGLTNEAWYNVKLVFHFDKNTVDLYITPRDQAGLEGATVTDIAIDADNHSITKLNYLLKRGRTDGDAGNALSILWNTYLDDFVYVYAKEAKNVDSTAFEAAKEAYQNATEGLNAEALSAETFEKASYIVEIMKKDVGFFTQEDYDFATKALQEATKTAPEKTNTSSVTLLAEEKTMTAGLSQTMTATLSEQANEQIVWSTSDENIASIVGNDITAVVTAKQAGNVTITATGAVSGVSGSITLDVTGKAFFLGTAKQYDQEAGAGFVDFMYPQAAKGWVNGIYYGRTLSTAPAMSFVEQTSKEYAGIAAQVWSELPEQSTREEDTMTYENTSAFLVDVADGNYTVSVTFTNPSRASMDVCVKAEDILRYDYGDHATSQIAETNIGAGQTKSISFPIAVTDGQLTLRFLQKNVATSLETASLQNVYVKSVSIDSYKTEEKGKTGIYVCGDSTVQTYTNKDTYRTGWGQLLYTLFGVEQKVSETSNGYASYETEDTIVQNYARDGRSSKSFLEEGRFNEVLLGIEPGDYVLAQFAHNDDNQARNNRFLSIPDYKKMLSRYADAIAERGGTLVLVTPIVLNVWEEDGTLDHRFDDYRLAMLEVANEKDIPVLDLMGATYTLVSAMGATNVKALDMYMPDLVHTRTNGAILYTRLLGNQLMSSEHTKLAGLKAVADCTAEKALQIKTENLIYVGDVADVTTDATETVTYVSSNEDVVKVVSGRLVAVAPGKAIITAGYTKGDLSTNTCTAITGYCIVEVTDDASRFAESGKSAPKEQTGQSGANDMVAETVSVFSLTYAAENTQEIQTLTEADTTMEASKVQVYTEAAVKGKQASPLMDYQFDFGTKTGFAGDPFKTITNQMYSEETGYGFVGDISGINYASHSDTSVLPSGETDYDKALRAAVSDAVRLATFSFAIDLKAGEYQIDLYSYDSWNNGWSDKAQFYINDILVGTKAQGKGNVLEVKDAAMSSRVVLSEDAQIVITATQPGRLSFLSAVTVNEYVDRVDAFDQAAWDAVKTSMGKLQVKLGQYEDQSTPFDFDAVLVKEFMNMQSALEGVQFMELADTRAGKELYKEAETALDNKVLYTENSIAKLETAMVTYEASKEALQVKTECNALFDVITYWLKGIDTTGLEDVYSLYVDFDSVQTGGNAYNNDLSYLTEGFVSVAGVEGHPYFTGYTKETGYGMLESCAGRNRNTGNSLLDDFMLGGAFAFDIPKGNYQVTVYTGDLAAGCRGASTYTFYQDYAKDTEGNVTGTLLAQSEGKITSEKASYTTSEYSFYVDADTTVTMVASGHTQAILVEQIKEVSVEKYDVEKLKELVAAIDSKNLVETDYTISTWNTFANAYKEAKAAVTAGASFVQQQETVYKKLEEAFQALTERVATKEYAIDFGPHDENGAEAKLWGSQALLNSFVTMENATVSIGYGDMLYETQMNDNGMHYGFTEEVASGFTATGGNYFRDWVYGAGGKAYTFQADVPAGDYYVYVYTGCKEAANTSKFYFGDGKAALETTNGSVSKDADGKTIYTQTSSAGGQFVAPGCIYKVHVDEKKDTLGFVKDTKMGSFALTVFNDDPKLAEDEVTARLCGIELSKIPGDDLPITEIKNEMGTWVSGSYSFAGKPEENIARIRLIDPLQVTAGNIYEASITDTCYRMGIRKVDEKGKVTTFYLSDKDRFVAEDGMTYYVFIYNYANNFKVKYGSKLDFDGYVMLFENGLNLALSDVSIKASLEKTEIKNCMGTWKSGTYNQVKLEVEANRGRIYLEGAFQAEAGHVYRAVISEKSLRFIVRQVDQNTGKVTSFYLNNGDEFTALEGYQYYFTSQNYLGILKISDFQSYVSLFENGLVFEVTDVTPKAEETIEETIEETTEAAIEESTENSTIEKENTTDETGKDNPGGETTEETQETTSTEIQESSKTVEE